MLLGKTREALEALHALDTAREIAQQPRMWQEIATILAARGEELSAFIRQITEQADYVIIFNGAGSSEYVGHAVRAALNHDYDLHLQSVGSTDIVANPHLYLSTDRPTLLISFARSGNSPESVGAVAAADYLCNNLKHLYITCNAEGALAKSAAGRPQDCFSLELPPETHDKSFAMTSSFTGMYLAALGALRMAALAKATPTDLIAAAGERVLADYGRFEQLVQNFAFERIVYLGAGPLKGIAQESALKMLELTQGKVVAIHDSPLGFRHGPKSILNDKTLTVIYLSQDHAARRYEMDLIREMSAERKGNKIVAICGRHEAGLEDLVDLIYTVDGDASSGVSSDMNSADLAPVFLIVAQLIALYKSLALGMTPDNPFPGGEVNRVVKGVTIYPIENPIGYPAE